MDQYTNWLQDEVSARLTRDRAVVDAGPPGPGSSAPPMSPAALRSPAAKAKRPVTPGSASRFRTAAAATLTSPSPRRRATPVPESPADRSDRLGQEVRKRLTRARRKLGGSGMTSPAPRPAAPPAPATVAAAAPPPPPPPSPAMSPRAGSGASAGFDKENAGPGAMPPPPPADTAPPPPPPPPPPMGDPSPWLGSVALVNCGERKLMGKILFVGPAEFASGQWIGIALDDKAGTNDGCVYGTRYFTCPAGHGIFMPPHLVQVADSAGGWGSPSRVGGARPVTLLDVSANGYRISDAGEKSDRFAKRAQVPSWASGEALSSALWSQYAGEGRSVDPDSIFTSDSIDTCDLESVFNRTSLSYKVRNSTGDWSQDQVLLPEARAWKEAVGIPEETEDESAAER